MFATWFAPWWDRPVGGLAYSDVAAVVAQMREAGRAPQTIHNVFNVAHSVLAYAVDAGYTATNPAARVRRNLPPRRTGEVRQPLTRHQLDAVVEALPAPYGCW